MAIPVSLVAHILSGSTSGNTFTSGSIDTTGATLLVACVVNSTGSAAVSDSKSNTWSSLTAKSNGSTITAQIFYCVPSSVGSGHTFTATVSNGTFPAIAVMAFSGTTASPFDQQNSGGVQNVTSLSSGSVTPTQDGEIVVSFFGSNTSSSAFGMKSTVPATVTDSFALVGSQHFAVAASYSVQGVATAVTPTWVWDAVSTLNTTVVATFKAAPAVQINRALLPAGVSAMG